MTNLLAQANKYRRIPESGWSVVGTVGQCHGLHGAFFVLSPSETISPQIKDVYLSREPENCTVGLPCVVKSQKFVNNRLILTLAGLDHRPATEPYQGWFIWAQLSREETLRQSLLGTVLRDSEGQDVGIIDGFSDYGASQIVHILKDDLVLDVPFVKEHVTLEDGKLSLTMPRSHYEGLWQ